MPRQSLFLAGARGGLGSEPVSVDSKLSLQNFKFSLKILSEKTEKTRFFEKIAYLSPVRVPTPDRHHFLHTLTMLNKLFNIVMV